MKRSYEQEMMDSPNHPQDLLEEDLKNLRLFNRFLGGYRCVESAIAEVVCQQRLKSFSLLDVGTGSADIPGRVVRWCQRRSIDISVVALDQDPVTARLAACRTRLTPEITVLRGDAANTAVCAAFFRFRLGLAIFASFFRGEGRRHA